MTLARPSNKNPYTKKDFMRFHTRQIIKFKSFFKSIRRALVAKLASHRQAVFRTSNYLHIPVVARPKNEIKKKGDVERVKPAADIQKGPWRAPGAR
jgi:hypothetical protein